MIIMKLTGGLGNQLFQYSLGRHLAHINNTGLQLDISGYEANLKNKKSIISKIRSAGAFFRLCKPVYTEEIRQSKLKHFNINAGIYNGSGKDFVTINEEGYSFDPEILTKKGNLYVTGQWQSEKYFKDIENTIKKEITLKNPFGNEAHNMLKKIADSDSVSIHVRRTDYVTNKKTNAFHGVCPKEYYDRALLEILKTVKNPSLFVFSDDIEWCKANLKFNFPMAFVDELATVNDYEKVILMSLCKHNIIANSTFSWWAAWLNANPSKTVIAPKKWFNAPVDTSDLVPSEWIRL